jgi:glucose-1-phosphate thymidylyltransferase
MKGLILAAGASTRLKPVTLPVSKILLPVYDVPMVYCPLCTLMDAGIRDILLITNKDNLELFKRTLGDGSQFGVNITYEIQVKPVGIADAFIIAKDFIKSERSVLILADNLFYGGNSKELIADAARSDDDAIIFAKKVNDPERFGVVEFDDNGNVISIQEKPKAPKTNYAAVGIYFFNETVSDRASRITPSSRNELEITDLCSTYIGNGLTARVFSEDTTYEDMGTFGSLLEAGELVRDFRKQGELTFVPEKIALDKGWISAEQLNLYIKDLKLKNNEYYNALLKIVEE